MRIMNSRTVGRVVPPALRQLPPAPGAPAPRVNATPLVPRIGGPRPVPPTHAPVTRGGFDHRLIGRRG